MTFLEEHHKNNVLTYLKQGNYYNKTPGNRAFLSSVTRISFFFLVGATRISFISLSMTLMHTDMQKIIKDSYFLFTSATILPIVELHNFLLHAICWENYALYSYILKFHFLL